MVTLLICLDCAQQLRDEAGDPGERGPDSDALSVRRWPSATHPQRARGKDFSVPPESSNPPEASKILEPGPNPSQLLYKAVLLEPRPGYLFGGFVLDVYRVVQPPQRRSVQLLGDGDEDLPELRVLLEHALSYGKRRVVHGEEILVVLEEPQVQLPNKPACRKHHAEVADLALVGGLVDRIDGHLYEVLLGEAEPVGPLQPRQPVEAGAEVVVVVEAQRRLLGPLLDQALQVRDGLDAEFPLGLLTCGDGVRIVTRRRVQPPDAVLLKVLTGHGLVLLLGVGYG